VTTTKPTALYYNKVFMYMLQFSNCSFFNTPYADTILNGRYFIHLPFA